MADQVADYLLTNFKHRYRMRLELFKMALALPQEGQGDDSQGKGALDEKGLSAVDDLIVELDEMTSATWQGVSEFQERFFAVCMNQYQQAQESLQERKTALPKKPKIPPNKNEIKTDEKPTAKEQVRYSTRAMDSMQSAIETFWLDFDPKHPPTQKQVSNFIAEQLGEPIRNRFTDELARAIKPENI